MSTLLHEPLFYIFFVYGMSFLVMAYVVLHGIRNATAITLVTTYYALALFGLMHGVTELVDWVRFIVKTTGNGEIAALKYASQVCLIASFVVLLQFGVNLLTYRSDKARVLRFAPGILFVVYLVALSMAGVNDILRAGLIARYSFGFAGALLSAIALAWLAQSLKDVLDTSVVNGLTMTAFGFGAYAVFGGLIIKPIGGLPIQLFRAACAFVVAWASFYILGIFKATHGDEPAELAQASAAGQS
jgi:hypothetical protein